MPGHIHGEKIDSYTQAILYRIMVSIGVLATIGVFAALLLLVVINKAQDAATKAHQAVVTAQQSVDKSRCEHLVLAQTTHDFHLSVAAIELAESRQDMAAIVRLSKSIAAEPNIQVTMARQCK